MVCGLERIKAYVRRGVGRIDLLFLYMGTVDKPHVTRGARLRSARIDRALFKSTTYALSGGVCGSPKSIDRQTKD